MPTTFVAAGASSATNGSAPTPGLPAGLQAGDLMVCAFYSREFVDGTVAISAGWQQRVNERTAGGLLAVWGRVFQVGMTAPTLTLGGHATGASGNSAIAQVAAWRPSEASTPLVIEGTPATNASQQNIGPIGGLIALPGDVVLCIGGKADDWTSVATLAGDGLTWNEIGEPDTTSGADAGLVWNYAIVGNALTTVTPKTFVVTDGAANVGKGCMFALTLAPNTSLGVEYLCKAVNATHTDPEKDARGCYKLGDIVLHKPLGWEWGAKELLPPADGGKFARIVVTDVPHDWLANVTRNKWNKVPEDSENTGVVVTRRRQLRIDIDLLPGGVLQTLNQTGVYTTDWATLRAFVRDKLSNQTAG